MRRSRSIPSSSATRGSSPHTSNPYFYERLLRERDERIHNLKEQLDRKDKTIEQLTETFKRLPAPSVSPPHLNKIVLSGGKDPRKKLKFICSFSLLT